VEELRGSGGAAPVGGDVSACCGLGRGRASVALSVFWASVDVVVAQVPRFTGCDEASASPADDAASGNEWGLVHPKQQWPGKPLKTEGSAEPVRIPQDPALMLSASVQRYPSEMMVTNGEGTDRCGPWIIERAVRDAREQIDGLPEAFSFHDLRNYLVSLLIASGADIKTVQARMRHASARTTLDTYSHLWPDADESTRAAVGAVIAERMESAAYPLRGGGTDLRR
jgi:hypothetical protein